ncbi:hypothetical protein FEM48_Zijuj02G0176500 [Ziziphus jujuba var. spinosa]|uniref:Cupin type-1 domain-containing protein n=1 Tax=Ziziphus jujuba var. spinosa TaxID=714518 RepID=A0A978VX20_ZIZJJ|nr:hypothetical protein FEM48_Zijuj02G0176500 [Ziziphus jujuba var. spinosa]
MEATNSSLKSSTKEMCLCVPSWSHSFLVQQGDYNAVVFAALSSQNARVITITNVVLGSDPRINPDVLTKAFQVDKNIIDCAHLLLSSVILALACSFAFASDPDPVQDFCVALNDTKTCGLFVNGKFCKDPKLADAGDFFFSGLDKPGNTSNPVGSNVTPVAVNEIPGLNTLGISLARIDFAAYGLNPPHTHPRATEILVVVEGALEFNRGDNNALAFAGLSSQNPGVIIIANAVIGSDPHINPDVLTKAFQVDKNIIISRSSSGLITIRPFLYNIK